MEGDKKPTQLGEDWLASSKNRISLPGNAKRNIGSGLVGSERTVENGDELTSSNNLRASDIPPFSSSASTNPTQSTSASSWNGSSICNSQENGEDTGDGTSIKVIATGMNLTIAGNDPGQFQIDKLLRRPPLKRKNKQMIPDAQKNEKYWVQRAKNNAAAQKSRASRYAKQNELFNSTFHLEAEYVRQQQEYIMVLQNAIRNCQCSGSQQPRESVIKFASSSGSNINTLSKDKYMKKEINTQMDQNNLVEDKEEGDSREN